MPRWTASSRESLAYHLHDRSFPHILNRPMNPSLSDPNNHAPDVSPGDVWGDGEAHISQEILPAAFLPPRRKEPEKAPDPTPATGDAGLRIDLSSATRPEPQAAVPHLEVQEISGSVVRLDQPEMPPAGTKVPRHKPVFQKRPGRESLTKHPRGEGRDWGSAHRHPILWLGLASAGIVATVIGGMLLLPKINASVSPGIDSERHMLVVENEENIEGIEALNAIFSMQSEAVQIFAAYSRAADADAVIPLVRDGDALQETIRKHWQPRGLPAQWAPEPSSAWHVLDAGDTPFALIEGNFPDHTRFSAYFVREGARLVLDWKATEGFGSASFEELAKGIGNTAEVRGTISPAEFYSATWPENDFQSYRLVSPDQQTAIWCYARRGDAKGAEISRLFQQGEIIREAQGGRKITLRLERGTAEALPNQWLIGEMLHIEWIKP